MHDCDYEKNDQIRLASFGLILQVLDSVKESFEKSYIILPDGTHLEYATAVAYLEDSVSHLVSSK